MAEYSVDLDALAQIFAVFGERECRGYSPLYARLCEGIAADRALLALAAETRSFPVPNVFLGAVHYLLLGGVDHPLAAFYPSVAGEPAAGDPVPAFRDFCATHADRLRPQLHTRLTQTNEVRRCACLLPVFAVIAARSGAAPFALVEIGASLGLNLYWDRYRYTYGSGETFGPPDAPLHLTCASRGDPLPPLPETLPAVTSRVGLDLNPIDVRDADAVAWVRALIWPEHAERAARFQAAVHLVRRDPPRMVAGDAAETLGPVLEAIPADRTACVYHTYTANQFPEKTRRQLHRVLDAAGRTRPVYRTSIEGFGTYPTLRLRTYAAGAVTDERLAACQPHGEWIAWGRADADDLE